GALVIDTALGPVRMARPPSWTVSPTGEKSSIDCGYVLLDDDRFGFTAPGRDEDLALVVDPGLVWSTFAGGGTSDWARAVALEPSGAATVAGETDSASFPATPGAFDTSHNGRYDAFVTRIAADGRSLVWSTFVGGNRDDFATAVAVDAGGATTVAGDTLSADFPVTAG